MTATMPKADVAEADPLYVASGATDAEVAAAIADVNTALAAKQESSTAATDAELTAAVSTLNAALAAKQDAATAATDQEVADAIAAHAAGDATDAELAAAVATLQASIAAKQDAATAATDAEVAALIAATKPVSGLLANRPAPSSANQGLFYWATDDAGGTLYLSDGAAWVLVAPRAASLLSLERTATNVSLTSSAFADVTGLNGTVVSRGRPLRVEFGCGLIQCTVAGNGLNALLLEDVGDTGTFTNVCHLVRPVQAANGFNSGGVNGRDRPAQPAGTVIRYKVQMANIAAGAVTTTVFANATDNPLTLSVSER